MSYLFRKRKIKEADILDLNHDAQKIKGRSVDAPLAGDDGKAITYDETNDKFKLQLIGGTSHQSQQVVGTTDNPGTSSTSYIVMPEMSISMTTGASKLLILFTATVIGDVKGTFSYFEVFVDGVAETNSERLWVAPYAWWEGQIAITWLKEVTAGSHAIEIRWKTNGWTEGYGRLRALQVIEL